VSTNIHLWSYLAHFFFERVMFQTKFVEKIKKKSHFIFWWSYDLHRNRFLVNKTTRRTEFQFYWYYDSTCFGQPFCPSSGVLSRTSALVHFMQMWWPFATRSRMERSSILLLVANGHHICIKRTKADVRLRTPDDGQKGCPKHVES